jgi:hypothetical protein
MSRQHRCTPRHTNTSNGVVYMCSSPFTLTKCSYKPPNGGGKTNKSLPILVSLIAARPTEIRHLKSMATVRKIHPRRVVEHNARLEMLTMPMARILHHQCCGMPRPGWNTSMHNTFNSDIANEAKPKSSTQATWATCHAQLHTNEQSGLSGNERHRNTCNIRH